MNTTTPKWQQEFPNFPAADIPALSAEWEDHSWHNDAGPTFYNPRLRAWVFILPRDRALWQEEVEGLPRISAYYDAHDNAPLVDLDKPLAEGEEWADVLAAIENPETERRWICDRWTVRLDTAWHPDTRGEAFPDLTEYEQAEYDANMDRLAEISPDQYADGLAAWERAGLIDKE